jgi:hypothetical protein
MADTMYWPNALTWGKNKIKDQTTPDLSGYDPNYGIDRLKALSENYGGNNNMLDTSGIQALKDVKKDPAEYSYGADLVDAQRAGLRGADELAKLYGNINFNNKSLEELFKGAAQAEFNEKDAASTAHLNRMDQGFSDVALQREMLQQRELANRVQSGASQGMSTVNAMLENRDAEQQFSDQRLEALIEKRNLQEKLGTAKAKAMVDAEAEATARKQFLGQLGSSLYATDNEAYMGELGHNASIEGARINAEGQSFAANRGVDAADITGQHNTNAARIEANASIKGQEIYRDATLGAANITAEGAKAIAQLEWDSNSRALAGNMLMEFNKGKFDLTKPGQAQTFLSMYGDFLGLDMDMPEEEKNLWQIIRQPHKAKWNILKDGIEVISDGVTKVYKNISDNFLNIIRGLYEPSGVDKE